MKASLRVAVAALVILTIWWIKGHLDYVRQQWGSFYIEKLSGAIEDVGNTVSNVLHGSDNGMIGDTSVGPPADNLTEPSAFKEPAPPVSDKVIVMAKLNVEDTSWVAQELPDWDSAIYTVDDTTAPLHTAVNKGNEANVYLTYIIEHYENLPATMAFLHSHRDGYPGGWHTDAPNHDNVIAMQTLQIDYIQRAGYANLRCINSPGCPNEIQPFRAPSTGKEHRAPERAMADAWRYLFQNLTPVPEVIATPCCAQFAVSRDQVRRRPLEDYVRFHTWLMETGLESSISGRVFEYLWHVIFGQEAVFCPSMKQCYRDVYGH